MGIIQLNKGIIFVVVFLIFVSFGFSDSYYKCKETCREDYNDCLDDCEDDYDDCQLSSSECEANYDDCKNGCEKTICENDCGSMDRDGDGIHDS
ncbi:MAG: hypothetical protein ACOCZ6_04230 [Nanoarchaeota archaeon]